MSDTIIQTIEQTSLVEQMPNGQQQVVQALQNETLVVREAGQQGPPGAPGLPISVFGITRITASQTPPESASEGDVWIKF